MTTTRRSARRLVRRWWPVALAVPLGAAAGAGYAAVSHPSYAASAYVLVVAQNPGEAATATNFAQAYGRLAGQPQVLAVAAAETGHSRAEMEALVHGTTSPDAPMIEITGTGGQPQEAARTADAVARSLVSFANASSKDTNVRLVTLAPAAEPDKPTTPSGKLDVAVGGAAGVLIGALVMMTRRRPGTGDAQAVPAEETPETPEAAATPSTPRPRSEEQPAGKAAAEVKAEPETGAKDETKGDAKGETKGEAKGDAKPDPRTKPAKEKSAAGSAR
ncbi:Wzz/FepE/Etk N-terminal domain-containing protein [Streptomyces sp. NRRL WC-3742]|uniref:Wzz/FepE/Etk N-terminal domain-containing protein n=1 Tax=Streptomyces sp. NRRL WC-3742 TaxID=1463934 RepID=UPI00068E7827|nr:Wzz/FepE/Etk N-terminal domain-containing protein [Streptomyces sp. NRRL WC-3742]